jgi:hypothetical protein
MEIQFSMDLAWDINRWTPEKAYDYPKSWAAETFGAEYADEIAHIKREYYRLANAAKPEHVDVVSFTEAEANQRLADYQNLRKQAEALQTKIPANLQDAYFELILYPVSGACLMNEKIFYAKKSFHEGDSGKALADADKAKAAFEEIHIITKKYNEVIAGGKWNGIMSDHPRDQKVFKMPATAAQPTISTGDIAATVWASAPKTIIAADQYADKKESGDTHFETLQGLGITGKAVTVMPVIEKSYMGNVKNAPSVDYKVNLIKGTDTIIVKCLPTFHLYKGFGLHYAISVNGDEPQLVDIDSPADSKVWGQNVLRGYSMGQTNHRVSKDGQGVIRIYFIDPSVVLSQLEVR